jgi:hypothetical protein
MTQLTYQTEIAFTRAGAMILDEYSADNCELCYRQIQSRLNSELLLNHSLQHGPKQSQLGTSTCFYSDHGISV